MKNGFTVNYTRNIIAPLKGRNDVVIRSPTILSHAALCYLKAPACNKNPSLDLSSNDGFFAL